MSLLFFAKNTVAKEKKKNETRYKQKDKKKIIIIR